jgi:hypothetical protein
MGLLTLWARARRVATETVPHADIPISLERVDEHGYAFRLGVRAGIGGQEAARIPIQRVVNPAPHPILKEVHRCEVGGRQLEAANMHALQAKVSALLEQVAPGQSLPLLYFRAPEMDYELPVYEEGGHYVSPIVGGQSLKAEDLAGIRGNICRYLVSAGYVTGADEVEVGVLRPSDLRRVPSAAVFRSYADPDLWLPAVEGTSPEGVVIGILEQATRLRRPERRRAGAGPLAAATPPAAPDVIELLRYLRTELSRSGGVADPSTLYASEVREEIWSAAQRHTQDTGRRLIAYMTDDQATTLELAVLRTGFGEVATAVQDRGINVFLGWDEDALATIIGRYLAGEGFLRFATEVEVHAVEAPRAERLDADSILTADYEEVGS